MKLIAAPLIHSRLDCSASEGSGRFCRCCRRWDARCARPYVGEALLEGNIQLGGGFLRILAVDGISLVKVGVADV